MADINNADFTPEVTPGQHAPARGNYRTLHPFMMWCQKVLPLVYDESLSYYEVLCKVVDYLNKTMEDVGVLEGDVSNIYAAYDDLVETMDGNVQALLTAYNELQDYVNTYFDNLDVQEEINNKLDVMATDGTLSALVSPFIPAQVTAWLNAHVNPDTGYVIDNTLTISGAAADAKVIGDYLNHFNAANILNLKDKISFTPGTYIKYDDGDAASLPDTSASDYMPILANTAIFIINNFTRNYSDKRGLAFYDSNYQYLSGVQQTETSLYTVAPVNACYYRFTIETSKLDDYSIYQNTGNASFESLNLYHQLANLPMVNNKYVNYTNGNLSNFNWSDVSDFLPVIPNSLYVLQYMNDNQDTRGMAFYDLNKNYISGVQYNYGNLILGFVPSNAVYVRFSVLHINNVEPFIYFQLCADNLPIGVGNVATKNTLLENYYIHYGHGGAVPLTDSYASDFIPVIPNSYFYFNKVNGTFTDNRGLAFYDFEKTYVSGIQYRGDKPITGYVPANAHYIRYTSIRNSDYIAVLSETDYPVITENPNILTAFDNITCIGDSLTYGQVYTGQSTSRQAKKPYPTILATITGANTTNIAHTGYSSTDWWNNYANEIVQKTNQLTIIYLGTNIGFTDTVETDCAGDDYTTWANTETGNLGKIIAKSLEVGSKVVLLKPWITSGDSLADTQKAIDDLGEKLNVAVADSIYYSNRKYHAYPNNTGQNTVHYNDFGYAAFAKALCDRISALDTTMLSRIIPS